MEGKGKGGMEVDDGKGQGKYKGKENQVQQMWHAVAEIGKAGGKGKGNKGGRGKGKVRGQVPEGICRFCGTDWREIGSGSEPAVFFVDGDTNNRCSECV